MNCRRWTFLLALLALFGAGIQGALAASITYVDAKSGAAGNTALAAGGVFSPPLNGTTGLDNQWEERTSLGNGSNIFESAGEGPAVTENAPRLVTTVTGLTPGSSYKMYAFFWSPNDINQQWLLRASLTNAAGELPSWTRLNNDAVNNAGGVVGTDTDSILITPDNLAPFPAMGPADFSNPGSLIAATATQAGKTVISESARFLWQAALGIAVADANGEAKVYVDNYTLSGGAPPTGTETVNNRTWYDGVGFEVVPEPTALVSMLLGMPALMLWRNRARRAA